MITELIVRIHTYAYSHIQAPIIDLIHPHVGKFTKLKQYMIITVYKKVFMARFSQKDKEGVVCVGDIAIGIRILIVVGY